MARYLLIGLGLLALLLFQFSKASTEEEIEFYNGVNFVSTGTVQKTSDCFKPLEKISANSVAIVPFCYGKEKTGELTTNPSWQWWGESPKGVKKLIELAQSENLKVMLKPQVWFGHNTFTGHVKFDQEEKWNRFFSAYKSYILEYAKMCEEKSVDIFCISTELGAMIKEKPIFWTDLISSVKSIYKGKITYAANWDNYDEVPFWKELDFIGVDAYFPVSESKTPTAAEVNEGWQTQITDLRLCSEKWKKNVLFCEYGFRSVDYAAKEPWNAGSETKGVNLQAQSNSYEGTYNSVWKEDFMAGGFLWKWYPSHEKSGGEEDNRFTPQNKPAEKIIKSFYD